MKGGIKPSEQYIRKKTDYFINRKLYIPCDFFHFTSIPPSVPILRQPLRHCDSCTRHAGNIRHTRFGLAKSSKIPYNGFCMDNIRVYTGGIAACNGYLVITGDNTYIAIDAPLGFVDWILSRKPDAKITDLLITHQHFDHIQDAAKFKKQFGCTIHAHSPYSPDLTLETLARNAWDPDMHVEPFEVDDIVDEKRRTANWGGQLWHIHFVPGHSTDSNVYHLVDEDKLFSGDVLFAGSIGRTDLPGGDEKQLLNGIHARILNQPATTIVLPGHGPYTTVKHERLTNPFLS